MPRIFRHLPFAALVVCCAFPAVAQVQLLKPQTIQFAGSKEYSAAELLAATGLKKGQTYTANFFNQSAQKLMASGVFESVSFKFDGVDLIYSLGDNPELYAVIIDNLPLDPAINVDAELHKRIPLYHGKVPSEGSTIEDVKQAFQAMLAEEGIKTSVTAIPAGDPRHKATAMRFRMDAPQVKIGDLHLTGVSDALAPDVSKAVAQHVSQAYDSHTTEHIEDAVANLYHERGYAAAKVQVVRAGAPVVAADAIRIPYDVNVDEGHVYKLGSVKLGTSVPLTLEDITKTLPSRDHFKPESFYADAIRTGVESRLRAKGYLDCSVTSTPAIDEAAGSVNYTIEAVPGPVYHLGLLKFDNVSDAMRALLMRSWQMMPGDPFNESYVSNFIVNAQMNDPVLRRSLAGVKATYNVHADPDTRDVNLVIRLERQ